MKNIKLVLLTIASLSILASCQKEDANEPLPAVSSVKVNNDSDELNKRVTIFNEPIQLSNRRSAPNYIKVASVAPNVLNGNQLSATAVGFKSNKVFVSYHVRGNEYGSELLTFNVNDPSNPWIDQSITDITKDYNDLNVSSQNIWIAGASRKGATAWKFPLNSFDEPTGSFDWELRVEGPSANSIERVDNSSPHEIWITAGGSTGGLYAYDAINPTTPLFERPWVDYAKHFDADGDIGVMMEGNGAVMALAVYDLSQPTTSFTNSSHTHIHIGADITDNGKNTVRVDEASNTVFVATGDDGVYEIDVTTKQIINHYDHGGSGYVNSIDFDDNYVYVANGADGLLILDRVNFQLQGQYKFDGSAHGQRTPAPPAAEQ